MLLLMGVPGVVLQVTL